MAGGVEEAEKSLKELEEEITCSICQEHYTQPKVLPCLHYYCKHCILKLALRTGKDKPFGCPECRKEAILPEGSEENLPTAFFVNRFKALYDKQERALSRKEIKCELCTTFQVKAEAFCRQCDKFLCGECIKSHPRMNVVIDGHEVISLDEIKKVRAKEVLTKNSPAKMCQLHNELLKMFCFDCNRLICSDCTLKDHKDHEFELNHVVAMNKRKELIERLTPLREVAASLSHAVEEVEVTEHELAAHGESVANKIEISFNEFHTILERHKQKMLEESKRRVSEKMENLQGQKKSMSISSAQVQRIVDYTEQCVKHYSDEEIMCVHAEIWNHIEREIEDYNKPGRCLVPVEEVDIGVEMKCAEALEHLLQTQTKIIELPVSLVIDRIASKAEVNKLSEVSLYTTKLCNNKPTKRTVQIDCQQKSLCNGSLIKSNIEEIAAGQYCIQYIPTLRGRHELTISVNGQRVAGSPFPVLVPIPPAQLGKPIEAYGGITDPNGITVNSVGEIVVVEYEGDVVVLNKEGKRMRSINRSEHGFQRLQGVAVDGEDNIYFTDLDTNQIFKSNENSSQVQVYRVQQMKGPGHLYVAVVGDEVMVTECGNEGRIMVYDRELKYVRQIVGADKNTLWCLSSDCHQNVYVSVLGNPSIQVFSNDGEFLRCFGCVENDDVKRLKHPCGVCVAGEYVYVADYGIRKIVVFTTEGDYVTSFGGRHYSRVCVDQDGFVYASHYNYNKIDIY